MNNCTIVVKRIFIILQNTDIPSLDLTPITGNGQHCSTDVPCQSSTSFSLWQSNYSLYSTVMYKIIAVIDPSKLTTNFIVSLEQTDRLSYHSFPYIFF